MHARNVYLVLNLHTGLVSPHYHCRFDDFFETTRHGSPEVSDNVTWQQLAKLDRAYEVLQKVSEPILHRPNLGLSPSDSDIPSEDTPVTMEEHDMADVDWDAHSNASGESQDTEFCCLREILQVLLSQPVLANVNTYVPCQGVWPTLYHSKISMVQEICTTWLPSP